MIKLGIYGSTGRMGQAILNVLKESKEALPFVLHSIEDFNFAYPQEAKITSCVDEMLKLSEVIIDFSTLQASKNLLEAALENPKPLVIGTTGFDDKARNLLKEVSKKAPVLYATNMSLGVAVLNKLTVLASSVLKDFDIEIVEQHHRYKKDAPSGTAVTLAKSAASARGLDFEKVKVSGRDGLVGARSKDEIGIFALRGGDVAGRHRVGFYNDGEYIELNHIATGRETFAKGAVKAAIWLYEKENGLYSINDCLGL